MVLRLMDACSESMGIAAGLLVRCTTNALKGYYGILHGSVCWSFIGTRNMLPWSRCAALDGPPSLILWVVYTGRLFAVLMLSWHWVSFTTLLWGSVGFSRIYQRMWISTLVMLFTW
jgi:hypothetical protein